MIQVKNLSKSFENKRVLKNISFNVKKGKIVGILGHNGAGKSTLIKCMVNICKADEGDIQYNFDIDNMYKYVGVQMQQSYFEEKAKVIDICKLYKDLSESNINIDKLLKDFGLLSEKNNFIRNLSGGSKQKLSILLTIINNPKIIFLDELTTGLDLLARRNIWKILKKINSSYNTTIVFTSHFLDEIQYLSDEIIIMNKGEISYKGTVESFIEQNIDNKKTVEFTLKNSKDENIIKKYNFEKIADLKYKIYSDNIEEVLKAVMSKVCVENLTVKTSTFQEVFLKTIGYKLDNKGEITNE